MWRRPAVRVPEIRTPDVMTAGHVSGLSSLAERAAGMLPVLVFEL
jgi:hypothetical protein